MRRSLASLCAVAALTVHGLSFAGPVDPATVDRGSLRPPVPLPHQAPLTLPGGTRIEGTPAAQRLNAYLASGDPAGRRFELPSIRFVKGMEVREDPNGSIASLSAVLRSHPHARGRIEVALMDSEEPGPSPAAVNRAREVVTEFERNGVPVGQLSPAGAKRESLQDPRVALVITRK